MRLVSLVWWSSASRVEQPLLPQATQPGRPRCGRVLGSDGTTGGVPCFGRAPGGEGGGRAAKHGRRLVGLRRGIEERIKERVGSGATAASEVALVGVVNQAQERRHQVKDSQ